MSVPSFIGTVPPQSKIKNHTLDGNWTGDKYLDFSQHNLPQLHDQLTQKQREETILQHDGRPPILLNDVRPCRPNTLREK